MVSLLLGRGANVNIVDMVKCFVYGTHISQFGQSPLREACRNGHVLLADVLLDHGADVNLQNQMNQTALHSACDANDILLVSLLLNRGANASLVDWVCFFLLE
jgi:ankyrin repeat protein